MKNINLKLKISIFPFSIFLFTTILFSIFYFLNSNIVNAANQEFLVSWQADSYAPSWYQGKILPTKDTNINVRFDLINNGKIVDLSKNKIRWYVNDKLIINENSGLGIKTFNTVISDYPGQETEIRISIFDYNGATLDKIIRIPIVNPEVVITTPYFGNFVSVGENLFRAIPFFFNINGDLQNLSVNWSVNNNQQEGYFINPWQLKLNVDSRTSAGTSLFVGIKIQNIINAIETASKNINLTVK